MLVGAPPFGDHSGDEHTTKHRRAAAVFSLKLTDHQAELDKQVRALTARLRAAGLAAERERTIPAELAADLDALGHSLYGGTEPADPLTELVVLEALAFGDPGIAYAMLPAFQLAHLVGRQADAERRARYLPRLAASWSASASLLYFEGYGRSPAELATSAVRDRDGWTVTGTKVAVHRPADAELSALIARDGTELVGFLLDRPPGRVVWDSWRTGSLGGGVRPTGEVVLDGVHCTDDQRLAVSGTELNRSVSYARLMLAAVLVGAAAAAVDYAGTYAAGRQAFGRALTAFQGVTFALVDADTRTESARLALWQAATELADAGEAGTGEPERLDELTGRAVRHACDSATEVTREGIQLLGVHGIVTEHPVERFWRHASTLSLIDFDPLATPLALGAGGI
jgi:alkylation response protein AidB-like acyl-CoA dehydrogenase